jgi:wyosine [tRNA(Phe)-imidazoG37] synthetase (radical SAM superfamily)
VPLKTCSYDCVYCQLGRTTHLSLERREYVPLAEVLADAEAALASGPAPDYVTLSGSGEPTLYLPLGELIVGLKQLTAAPIAVLTNGSLLWDPEVRDGLKGADLVVPSLDAGDQETFQRVNRPHRELGFQQMLQGLVDFRRGLRGALWLEVFLAEGVNAAPAQVERIARAAALVRPDRVQLNTVARPPAEPGVRGVGPALMQECLRAFDGPVESIADYQAAGLEAGQQVDEERVLGMLRRRPCTVYDVAQAFGLHPNEVLKYVGHLLRQGLVERLALEGSDYYAGAGSGAREKAEP